MHLCVGPVYGETNACIPKQEDNQYEECCDTANDYFWCSYSSKCERKENCCDKDEVWCAKEGKCVPNSKEYLCENCNTDLNNPIWCRDQCKEKGHCCDDKIPNASYVYNEVTDTCDVLPCAKGLKHCPQYAAHLCFTCCLGDRGCNVPPRPPKPPINFLDECELAGK